MPSSFAMLPTLTTWMFRNMSICMPYNVKTDTININSINLPLLLVKFQISVENTGCPKKNALLSLKAYNSGLEAAIGAGRDSFGILWLWAFIWDQEVQDYVKASLRKTRLKLATLSQNLTLLYHRYSPLIKNVLQCSCQAQVPKTWAQLDWGWHYNLIGHIT